MSEEWFLYGVAYRTSRRAYGRVAAIRPNERFLVRDSGYNIRDEVDIYRLGPKPLYEGHHPFQLANPQLLELNVLEKR